MKFILQTLGLAAATVICLSMGVWQFWHEVDFSSRAVPVEARVSGKHLDWSAGHQRATYKIDLRYEVNGRSQDVAHRVSRAEYLTAKVGDLLPVLVDPDNPRDFAMAFGEFALWGLLWSMGAMALGALTLLSGARARQYLAGEGMGWLGSAFPWL